jgi:AraC-like DNA-binding protein
MSRALSVFHGPFGRASLYELDRPLTRHAHREAHLIFFLGGARGRVVFNRAEVAMDHDTAAAVNPWEAHGFAPGATQGCGLYLIFYFKPEWLGTARGPALVRTPKFFSPRVQVSPDIREIRDDLCSLLMQGTCQPAVFEALLRKLIGALDAQIRPPSGPVARGGLDFRVKKSLAALSLDSPIAGDLGKVARESGLSRAHFFSLFQQQTGVTPVVYANTLRIENALDQIALGESSVTSISHQLGFSCQSAFTRFFGAHVGMAPTDYRNAIQVYGSQSPEAVRNA